MARTPDCLVCRDHVKPDTYCTECGLYDFRYPDEEPRKRSPLPLKLRRAVIARDGYSCGLCGRNVEPGDVHIDHVKPVALGGLDLLENLQVAHSRCNLVKGPHFGRAN